MSDKAGLTTTVPIEVIYAAGRVPVDLNNRFITSDDPKAHIHRAEIDGLPRNLCGWIKGLYAVGIASPDIDTIVGVTQGDCSNTHGLMELFERAGKTVVPFGYPYNADRDLLRLQIEKLMEHFDVTPDAAAEQKRRLDAIRRKLTRLDDMTWRDDLLTGDENHLWLVSASDMNGDPERFERELDAFLDEAASRRPREERLRLGYIGVPAIFSDLYQSLEARGARVVFNEMQRQFAMLDAAPDLVEQYGRYTYPYRIWQRIDDIRTRIARRRIAGIIHYVQSFCFRAMEDVILREQLEVPVLTLEGDLPGPLDARSLVRLESFLEMRI